MPPPPPFSKPEVVARRWDGGTCVVAASGPSLTKEVAAACEGQRVVAVGDAWRLFPDAIAVYKCERWWYEHHRGVPEFAGEKWTSHHSEGDTKLDIADRWGLRVVAGKHGTVFSTDPSFIYYGMNSGFQACNLALHFGATRLILVGFDMQRTGGRTHFFGEHPDNRGKASPFGFFTAAFDAAAKAMPPGTEILNATPGSALKAFRVIRLEDAFGDPAR